MDKWNVGVLIFDGVALLDVAGPFDVLTRARLEPGVESRRTEDDALFDVFTVAKTTETVTATGGIGIVPRHSFANVPRIDLLLVPGGFGTRPVLQDAETIEWIRKTAAAARRRPRSARERSSSPGPGSSTAAARPPTGAPSACSPRSPRTSAWTATRASWTTA
jgi:hypothetical protein